MACLYFLLQSCSGHSRSTGDIAHGEVPLLGFLTPATSLLPAVKLFPLAAAAGGMLLPLNGDGLSSFDFLLFSGRGAENVVGDVEGVFVTALVGFVDMFMLDTEEFLDALPFDPPFLSLL